MAEANLCEYVSLIYFVWAYSMAILLGHFLGRLSLTNGSNQSRQEIDKQEMEVAHAGDLYNTAQGDSLRAEKALKACGLGLGLWAAVMVGFVSGSSKQFLMCGGGMAWFFRCFSTLKMYGSSYIFPNVFTR